MLALIGVVVSVGLADSINPSTIGPALYLASGSHPVRALLGFIAGVFTVSSAAGILLVAGPGRLLLSHRPSARTEHLLELGAGVVLAAAAVILLLLRHRMAAYVVGVGTAARRAAPALGAGIMAAELPTAVPYFAVLAAVTVSAKPVATQIALVLLYNLMFVAPLLLILLVVVVSGGSTVLLGRGRELLERYAGAVVPAIVFMIALVLIAVGAAGLEA
jgi:Sap-like sulfolipid-1-addressing protein